MSPGQRTAPDNGIWLCQKCAKLIDSDTDRYTIAQLHEWKAQAERAAQTEIEATGAPQLMSGNEKDDRSVTVGGDIVGSTVVRGDHNEINVDQRTIHIKVSRPEIVKPVAAGEDRRVSNLQQRMTARRRFVGRKALLNGLRNALQSKRPTALTQTQAIHGLGGVGKTQLALEYARLHAQDYVVRWWIRAEQRTTLLSDLASLAGPLGLPDEVAHAPDLSVLAAEVLRILSERDGWLLIYDNADSPADLEGYLPGGGGHVIITSRNRNWGQLAESLPLDVLNLKESSDLLLGRSGQRNRRAAEDVARRLGRLPLALEVAGAYCQATGMLLSEYVVLLNRVGLELLDEHKPIDYHAVITATWRPSFDKACEQSPLAGDVLALMSFLAPDDIPRALVAAPHNDSLQFNAALASLLRYSLIDSKEEIFSIHGLVQEVFCHQLSDQERSQHRPGSTVSKFLKGRFAPFIQERTQQTRTN